MTNYIIAFLFPLLATTSVYVGNKFFPSINRPEIFRGLWGEAFFSLINLLTLGGTISGLIWIFSRLDWWEGIATICIAVFIVSRSFEYWRSSILGSSLGQIGAALGLAVLHWLAWY